LSEHTYRPELCLLQFATRKRSAAVDPYQIRDLSAWWRLMAGPNLTVVVHGGRAEGRVWLWDTGARPAQLFDVQIAEGLLSRAFPLNYNAIVSRELNVRTHGKETRTDWRRRPLTDRQIAYAIEDVEHLLEIYTKESRLLAERGRSAWAQAEFDRFVNDLEQEPLRENWRRLPGVQSLSARELAITRELYQWREQEGQRRDKPIRKVLRDDLIIELAHRQPRDVADLLATRDMNRSDYKRAAPEMLAAVQRGLALPRD